MPNRQSTHLSERGPAILNVMAGPVVRTDIVDVYVFRCRKDVRPGVEFLQLRRSSEPMRGTWQPVMGHIREGETAPQAALRELTEETGAMPRHDLLGLWQLEQPNVYYLASRESIMFSPCFAAKVNAAVEIRLNDEHDAARWAPVDHVDLLFLWPGQRAAIAQIVRDIIPADSPVAAALRIACG